MKIINLWGLLGQDRDVQERNDDGRRAARHHVGAVSPFFGCGWRKATKGKGTSFAHVRKWITRPHFLFARSSTDRAFVEWVARRTPSLAAR